MVGGGNPGAGSQAPLFLSVVIVMVPNAVLAFRGVFCGQELPSLMEDIQSGDQLEVRLLLSHPLFQ